MKTIMKNNYLLLIYKDRSSLSGVSAISNSAWGIFSASQSDRRPKISAELDREDIFEQTVGDESLHKISNDNGVRVANFATSKNLAAKCAVFSSHDGKIHNQIDYIMIDRR
jgi:hypothetical protein